MSILKRFGLALALVLFPFAAFAQGFCPAGSTQARVITGTSYTVGQTDVCQMLVFNNASSIAVTLPAPGTAGGYLAGSFNFQIQVIGAGTVTVTPSAPFLGATPTINGQTTAQLQSNQGATFYVGTDGNYYANATLGGGSVGPESFTTVTWGVGSTVGGTLTGGSSAATVASTGGPLLLDAPSTNAVYVGGATAATSGLQVAPGSGTIVNQVVVTPAATGVASKVAAGGASADANANLSVAGNGTGLVLLGQTICTITGASPQTCNGQRGIVTTGTLTTAAATAASYTVNNSSATTASLVTCESQGYSGTYVTNGTPVILDCKPGSGTITVDFINLNASNALNGTLAIGFAVLN